jgi:hypothetical protein
MLKPGFAHYLFRGGDWCLSATQNIPGLKRNPHVIISGLERKG